MWLTVTKNKTAQQPCTFNPKTEETDSMFWLFQNRQNKSGSAYLRIWTLQGRNASYHLFLG